MGAGESKVATKGGTPPAAAAGQAGMNEVVLKVAMACEGCSGAVKRVLDKMEGVDSVDIDLTAQKVVVKGNVDPVAVKDTVAKTGKATEFWQ